MSEDNFLNVARDLKIVRAESMILKEENAALWRMVEAAAPSMKRDFARCRAAGETDERSLYKRWLNDLQSMRELKERKRNL